MERYRFVQPDDDVFFDSDCDCNMVKCGDGEWVKYSDISQSPPQETEGESELLREFLEIYESCGISSEIADFADKVNEYFEAQSPPVESVEEKYCGNCKHTRLTCINEVGLCTNLDKWETLHP